MSTRTSRVLVVVVVLALLGTAVVLLGRWFWSDATCQTPPSQQTRAEQEAFVSTHLPDAGDFRWTVMDCDDEGQVVLEFTTPETGDAASRAFVRDPACRSSTEPDAASGDVACRVGTLEVEIYLVDTGAAVTDGELTWTPSG